MYANLHKTKYGTLAACFDAFIAVANHIMNTE